MARRPFSAPNWTPTATADTTNLANGTFMALQGGTGSQNINIQEVFISGLSGSSAPALLQHARDTPVMATPTALASPNTDGPNNPATAALAAPPVSAISAGTSPQRAATTSLVKMNFSLNGFGGLIRWLADKGEEFGILGNTQPSGEASLSAFTGFTTGPISANLTYEPFVWGALAVTGLFSLMLLSGASSLMC